MIKNFVFDVGNVLVDFRYKDYMRDLGFSEDLVELLSKEMVVTKFWDELDLGIRTNAEGIEKFTKMFPEYKDEIIKFWSNLEGIIEEYDYSAGLIQMLKDHGYNVYALSNYPIETAEMHWPTFKFLPIMDGHIISGYEKITKPDERLYKLLETRFGVKLEECVFIDDRQINIDTAERLGMDTVLFKGYDELIETLKSRGYI